MIVFVRLREGGEAGGIPVPADGSVRLTPVSVPDAEAWVTTAPTVLTVVGGSAEPVEVSPGRWRVDAWSVSWARTWTLDLVDAAEPVNLATLTPVDGSAPIPWAPTESDLLEIRGIAAELRDLAENPVTVFTDGDGTYSLTRNDAPVPVSHVGDGAYQIGA